MNKVSIIVPVYNAEEYLDKCIKTLREQTLEEIEIICVDDGSTDKSLEILQKCAKEDERIKVLEQTNKKQGAARNAGIKIATGEYIGFVDADDWVDLDFFEKLYNAAKKYESDISMGTNVRIGGGKKTKKRLEILKEICVSTVQEKFDISKVAKNPCPTNKIYKREFLISNNLFFPENMFCEDKLFVTQAVYYAESLVAVPDVNYFYYRNPNSTVNSRGKHHLKTLLKDKEQAKSDVLNFLKAKNAEIRDKEFWALKKIYRLLGIPLYKVVESLHTEKHYLLGFIPLLVRTV